MTKLILSVLISAVFLFSGAIFFLPKEGFDFFNNPTLSTTFFFLSFAGLMAIAYSLWFKQEPSRIHFHYPSAAVSRCLEILHLKSKNS